MTAAQLDQVPEEVDPITVEILRGAFMAACNEMALVVAKTAYSTAVNEGRDFAGALYDPFGRQVSQGQFDLPGFVGITQVTVPEVIKAIGLDNMRAGDIYIINDPYIASTHCNDVHLVKPLFRRERIIGFTTSTAHWSDVGGVLPGSLNARARTHFEEGVRIPPIRIVKEGTINRDVLNIFLYNMREGWERIGDLNAQIAAVNTGGERFQALVDKHGLETVLACMAAIQNHTERMTRAALAAIPDGTYTSEDRVDMDIYTGDPVTIRLKLTISGDCAIFDLTESDGAAQSGINCSIAATTSAVILAMAAILPPMPMNAGVRRCIEIRTKPGSIVHALPPVGISGLGATSMESTIATVMQALTNAVPERGVAVPFSILNTIFAGSDARPEFGAPFINYVWTFGGWGATKYHDGPNAVASSYAGGTQNVPCELQERRYPILWQRYQIVADTGGPGRTRGGLALDQTMEYPNGPGTLSCIGNRARFGPPGAFGGGEGGKAGLVINHGTENERNIGIFAAGAPVYVRDVAHFWSAGGGGFGDPLERDPGKVVEDIKDDYVSVTAAQAQYGVVVKEIDRRRQIYEVDTAATGSTRKEMRAARARHEGTR